MELAECLGELVLAYAGLCAHRLEVGGDGGSANNITAVRYSLAGISCQTCGQTR
jgi:hypothetical protein